jgi:hypothetical protein
MATFWKWVWRFIFGVWMTDGFAGLYYKQVAINEIHDPGLVRNPVVFTSLGGTPMISAHTAFIYHMINWIFFICFALAILLQSW